MAAIRAACRASRSAADFLKARRAPASAPNCRARAPFGDIEVDFHDPALAQDQVHPQRQRQFQRLADIGAALPQEQVLGGLLGDGRAAPQILQVLGLFEQVAQRAASRSPRWLQNRASSDAITVRGRTGRYPSSGARSASPADVWHSARASASKPAAPPGKAVSADRAAAGRSGPRAPRSARRGEGPVWNVSTVAAITSPIFRPDATVTPVDTLLRRDKTRNAALCREYDEYEEQLHHCTRCRAPKPRICSEPCCRHKPLRAKSSARSACWTRCAIRALGGGKRLRPFLVVESAALFDVPRQRGSDGRRRARMRALLFAGP